jgi:hypothetical protein
MELRVINGYPQYTIYEDGTILNHETIQIMGATVTREKIVVTLTKNKKRKLFSYSRLVAEHFIPNPENKRIVRHIDGDFRNYHKDNLKWCNQGEWFVKYDNDEDRKEVRKKQFRDSRNKRDKEGKVKQEQKKWRQTDQGKFIRNRNHWIASGMREPEEGWKNFWKFFKNTTNCEICNVEFNLSKECTNEQRCLDHDHHSGYKRFICCRKCNSGCIRDYDNLRDKLIIELHRYFRYNNM